VIPFLSDWDLVVIVEQPSNDPPWSPSQVATERKRLQASLGPLGANVEVFVTTTDMFAAGHRVFGGIEWLVDAEGVDLFSIPYTRKPAVRRTPDQVRYGYAATWVDHSLRALEAASVPGSLVVAKAAEASIERALAALLVLHQIPTSKLRGAEGMLYQLAHVDPAFSEWAMGIVARQNAVHSAHSILKGVIERISTDRVAAAYVARARAIVSGTVVSMPR
jgi:hypothetical protein